MQDETADAAQLLAAFSARHGTDAATLRRDFFAQPLYAIEYAGRTPFDGEIRSLRITERYGRLGNNLFQLLNAIVLAGAFGCHELQIPELGLGLDRFPIRCGGMLITNHLPRIEHRPTLCGGFYAPYGFERYFTAPRMAVLGQHVRDLAGAIYGTLCHDLPRAEGCIGVHFRGGDVFSDIGHPWYVQPPVSYYTTAIRHALAHLGATSVHLVMEDRKNPCIEAVEDFLRRENIVFLSQSADLVSDARVLLAAEHIVASFGTFCESMALLSPHLRSYTGFRTIATQPNMQPFAQTHLSRLLRDKGVRLFQVDDLAEGYIEPKNWRRTPEQMATMLTYDAHGLRLFEELFR